jgi:NADP-dependent 3-hydroxy acid dehydrogenase YdfG
MKEHFKDKVVIITGASSGIGKETAITLSQRGAKVALAARNETKLREIENQIRSSGNQAIVFKTDVTKKEEIDLLINQVLNKWDHIDILIANAGQYIQKNIRDSDENIIQKSFDVNFFGVYYCIKKVLPVMQNQKSGYIVLVNSLDAKKGIVGDGPYVAAKSALNGFADVLRQEVKGSGIKVISVYPGRVDTPMIEHLIVPRISPKIPARKVVNTMLKGIIKSNPIVIVPKIHFFLGALNNTLPSLMDWLYKELKLEGKIKKDWVNNVQKH